MITLQFYSRAGEPTGFHQRLTIGEPDAATGDTILAWLREHYSGFDIAPLAVVVGAISFYRATPNDVDVVDDEMWLHAESFVVVGNDGLSTCTYYHMHPDTLPGVCITVTKMQLEAMAERTHSLIWENRVIPAEADIPPYSPWGHNPVTDTLEAIGYPRLGLIGRYLTSRAGYWYDNAHHLYVVRRTDGARYHVSPLRHFDWRDQAIDALTSSLVPASHETALKDILGELPVAGYGTVRTGKVNDSPLAHIGPYVLADIESKLVEIWLGRVRVMAYDTSRDNKTKITNGCRDFVAALRDHRIVLKLKAESSSM